MSGGNNWDTTDVVVCGCGPTGAMLSAYLGRHTVSNVVLEKEPDITTDPCGQENGFQRQEIPRGQGGHDGEGAQVSIKPETLA